MITTLTVNPAIDLTLEIDGLIVEDVNRVKNHYEDAGGKGINVSKVLHELGEKTVKTLAVLGGRDAGRFNGLLRKKAVKITPIDIRNETRINVTLFDLVSRETTKLNQPGPGMNPSELRHLNRVCLYASRTSRFFVAAGSLLPNLSPGWYGQIIKKMSRRGLLTVLDADGESLKKALFSGPWLIKPNRYEAERVLGKRLSSEKSLREGAKRLRGLGAQNVIISLGGEGVLYSGEAGEWRGYSIPIRPNSTVGAGDSFLAGFIFSYARHRNIPEALKLGLASGTHTAMTGINELCRKSGILKLIPKMKVKQIS